MITPVAPQRPLFWSDIVMTLRNIIPPGQEVYLVGGTVRDAYLHRPFHDIDLATPNDGRPLARQIADALKGAYYPLDAERGVGRVVITQAERTLTIDVAQFRGNNRRRPKKTRLHA